MKLKRLSACFLAVVLIFATALTSFAEVMNVKSWYDESEDVLYYFGRIAEDDTEAGVEINGKKYTLTTPEEPGKLGIAKAMNGNFGIGFKNPAEKLGKVDVKPYSKNANGETVYFKRTLSYDPGAVSDEAVLASLSTEAGVLVPDFDPNVTSYHIGLISDEKIPALNFKAAKDFGAEQTATATKAGETSVITVTDNKGKTREYSFTYDLIKTIDSKVTTKSLDSYVVKADTRTEKILYTANFSAASQNDRISFWKLETTTNESNETYDMAVYKFAFADDAVLDSYGKYTVDIAYASNATAGQEYEISTFEIKNNDLTRNTVTTESVPVSSMEVGKIISSTIVKGDDLIASGAGKLISLDVSSYARNEILAGNKDFSVGIAITGLKTLSNLSGEFIRIYHANSTNSRAKSLLHCESLDFNARLASAEISDEAAENGCMMLPSFDPETNVYYIGVPEGEELPGISFAAYGNAEAMITKEATAIGEETIVSAISKEANTKNEYKFIYETITKSNAKQVRAVQSQNLRQNGNVWQHSGTTYDGLFYYSNAQSGNNIYSIVRFELPEGAGKYDDYIAEFKTNAVIYGSPDSILTIGFNEVKWSDNWVRNSTTNTALSGFEIGKSLGTATLSGKNTQIYANVTEAAREALARGKKYFNISVKIINVEPFVANTNIYMYRWDYNTSISYGPSLMINPSMGISSASVSGNAGVMTPSFSKDVYDYEVVLSEEGTALPDIAYTLSNTNSAVEVVKAENVGESTVINVTTFGKTISYTFRYRNPYKVSETAAFTLPFAQGTTIATANKGRTWSSTEYIRVDRVNSAVEASQIPSYGLLRFDFTEKDVNPFGKFELKLTKRGSVTGCNIIVKIANTNQNWENKVATYNNTVGASTVPFDDSETASFSVDDSNIVVDISNIVRNQLLKNQKVFTLALEVDYSSITGVDEGSAIQPLFYIGHATASRNPSIVYYPVAE